MAELADAYGSGPYERKFMQVQVLLSALQKASLHGKLFSLCYYKSRCMTAAFVLLRFDLTAVNDLCRTGCHAGSAVGALAVVDRCVEVIDDNSLIGTFLLTDLTADTAVLAYQLCCFSVVSR